MQKRFHRIWTTAACFFQNWVVQVKLQTFFCTYNNPKANKKTVLIIIQHVLNGIDILLCLHVLIVLYHFCQMAQPAYNTFWPRLCMFCTVSFALMHVHVYLCEIWHYTQENIIDAILLWKLSISAHPTHSQFKHCQHYTILW